MSFVVSFDDAALQRVLHDPGGGLERFVRGECLAVEVGAKQRCPVDERQLQNSSDARVVSELARERPSEVVGQVVFMARHSAFVHLGTRPHWPPVDALVGWARRHGFAKPFLVARAIALHGTRAVPFLADAVRSRYPAATIRRLW